MTQVGYTCKPIINQFPCTQTLCELFAKMADARYSSSPPAYSDQGEEAASVELFPMHYNVEKNKVSNAQLCYRFNGFYRAVL